MKNQYKKFAPKLAELGYDTTPVSGKRPIIEGWSGRPDAAKDYDRYADNGIGVVLGGEHNLIAVDVDVTNPFAANAIEKLIQDRLGDAPKRVGKAPKFLMVFRTDEPMKKIKTAVFDIEASEDDGCVEVLAEGQQFVASGIHPDTGQKYQWPNDNLTDYPVTEIPLVNKNDVVTFIEAANTLLHDYGVPKQRRRNTGLNVTSASNPLHLKEQSAPLQEIDLAVAHIPNEDLHYDDWVQMAHAIKGACGEPGFDLFCRWSARSSKNDPAENERLWQSIGSVNSIGAGSIFHHASEYGFDISAYRESKSNATIIDAKVDKKTGEIVVPERDGDGLVLDSKGRIILNYYNVREIIAHNDEFDGVFAFDEFSQRKMLLKPIPGSKARKDFQPREIRDQDYLNVLAWINRGAMPRANKTLVFDAVDDIIMDTVISPVRHWLEDLKVDNSGEELHREWPFIFLDAQATSAEHREYIKTVAAKWLISAVARAMLPGCKADCALILEGAQGVGKSTTLHTLCGDEWFGDALPPMHTKDASDYVRGKWIVELAELSNVSKAEVEVVKAFISRSTERFRPAYGRSEITYKRQNVFAGTTNKADYLRDETGNRRFWPFRVGNVDIPGLRDAREQIWAHAVSAYKSGDDWWDLGDAREEAARQQDARLSTDEWTETIGDYVLGKNEVSITEVAIDALSMEVKNISRYEQNRISAILSTLGFARQGRFHNGEYRNRARFVRIE